MPEKLHPFWYTPLLPVFFFISAIAVGLAMTIFESSMSSKHFGQQLELPILQELGRVLVVVLSRLRNSAVRRPAAPGCAEADCSRRATKLYLFWLEMALALILPLILLSQKRIRTTAGGLYVIAVLVVLGFITNRLNVSITGMESSAGHALHPQVDGSGGHGRHHRGGFALFGLATKYLPIFSAAEPRMLEATGRRPYPPEAC